MEAVSGGIIWSDCSSHDYFNYGRICGDVREGIDRSQAQRDSGLDPGVFF